MFFPPLLPWGGDTEEILKLCVYIICHTPYPICDFVENPTSTLVWVFGPQ